MSGTQTADGDVEVETELAAEVSDNSSARELIERACTLLEAMNPCPSEAAIAREQCKVAVQWLLRGGL